MTNRHLGMLISVFPRSMCWCWCCHHTVNKLGFISISVIPVPTATLVPTRHCVCACRSYSLGELSISLLLSLNSTKITKFSIMFNTAVFGLFQGWWRGHAAVLFAVVSHHFINTVYTTPIPCGSPGCSYNQLTPSARRLWRPCVQ